jgi:hypothetical protein
MTCTHYQDGVCRIATELAGVDVRPDPRACEVCTGLVNAQQVNQVTLDLAIYHCPDPDAKSRLQERRRPDGREATLRRIREGYGPGSELWRLLESLGVRHTADCRCLELAAQMNAWGPIGCALARADIVARMRANASAYGWTTVAKAAAAALVNGLAWKLDLADVYGSLVDEAIRRSTFNRDPTGSV